MEGRPWPDWKAGKPLTPSQLARLLKPFGVISDSVRVGGKTPKGYYRHQFTEAWDRYLAAEGVYEPQQRNNAVPQALPPLFKAQHPSPMLRFKNARNPSPQRLLRCCGSKRG